MTSAREIERHHWVNTYVGLLDLAFRLSEDEQYYCASMLVQLLDHLDIPARGAPAQVPAAVALEAESGFYTVALYGPRDSGVTRPVREVGEGDIPVSIEAWRQMLLSMATAAYPDLAPIDRMLAAKVFTDILVGIGVPQRAASAYPEGLVRAYHETDEIVEPR